MGAPRTVAAILTVVALAACSAPRTPKQMGSTHHFVELDQGQGSGSAVDAEEVRPADAVILAAGGGRPPPRPPPVPARPPSRQAGPRQPETEPRQPGHVPGRRLAGPPDAPYWETVFEIPWRGGTLQGPKQPARSPGKVAEPAPPASRSPTPAAPQGAPTAARGDGHAGTLQPGPYAGESIPARGPGRNVTPAETAEINRIGRSTGCHTCGTTDPGTKSGNFVPDHQPPSALSPESASQRLYPQCVNCSRRQGGEVNAERTRKPQP